MSEDKSTFGMGVCVVEISDEERIALNALVSAPSEE
jgi:hypothetical protein